MDGKLLNSLIEVTIGCGFLVFFSALPSVPVGLLARWVAKKRGWRRSWPFTAAFFIAVATFFSYDVVITHALAWKFCHGEPNPKTFVLRKVEHPGSIYFEDNVYPGYDEDDRLNTIYNYLEGVDLTMLALNDPGGNIHVYTATPDDWQESDARQAVANKDKQYANLLRKEAANIATREQVFARETMPEMNYTVLFNPVSLPDSWLRYVWADEMTITDNSTGEVIAYNRRLIRKLYRFELDTSGFRFKQGALCGCRIQVNFDLEVFPRNVRINAPKHLSISVP